MESSKNCRMWISIKYILLIGVHLFTTYPCWFYYFHLHACHSIKTILLLFTFLLTTDQLFNLKNMHGWSSKRKKPAQVLRSSKKKLIYSLHIWFKQTDAKMWNYFSKKIMSWGKSCLFPCEKNESTYATVCTFL